MRVRRLREAGQIARLVDSRGLRVLYRLDGRMLADWKLNREQFLAIARAMSLFAQGDLPRSKVTIVGEVTAGAAHPADVFEINRHFGVFIPKGRAINPITGSN